MKLTEKELNEFPIGTKIIISNDDLYIKCKDDYFLTDIYWTSNKQILKKKIKKVEIPTTWGEYIPTKPILDDKEKEYLSYVIRPFRKEIKYIEKRCLDTDEYIYISMEGYADFARFPFFESNTMYKGMELDREYSLEELGL